MKSQSLKKNREGWTARARPSLRKTSSPALCRWPLWGILAAPLILSSVSLGCGPFFPNTLLEQGDQALLSAPQASFKKEIERMKLLPSIHLATPPTNNALQSLQADLSDLRAALEARKTFAAGIETVIQGHLQQREKIQLGQDDSLRPTNTIRIPGALPQIAPGLPREFADYFRGAIAWHQDNLKGARSAWMALLERPAGERHYKSTWAAFMLGRSWEEENRARAISYFQQVRSLGKAGFADSLGLAASSLGFEARLHLREKRFTAAIDLYLEQAAAGDAAAVLSLEWAASQALGEGVSVMRSLASHARAQQVVTAYVIAGGWREAPIDTDSFIKESTLRFLEKASTKSSLIAAPKPTSHTLQRPVLLWLEAVEAAKVNDVESAEKLALAAYQAGEMELAQRWLNNTRSSPLAQWLQAKLYLRKGKLDPAAALLAQLCRKFPIDPSPTNNTVNAGLLDDLYLEDGDVQHVEISARQQVRGELGLLYLARRQYAEALDALLHSEYWADAAYVAERVLTLDELKSFVEQHAAEAWERHLGSREPEIGVKLRHLLARRLARSTRRSEARPYYPSSLLPTFDGFCAALDIAETSTLPPAERARAYFEAAKIIRKSGLQLVATELAPDWALHYGDFETGFTVQERSSLQANNQVVASGEELQRAMQHGPNPELRWHYRYTAASLAWEAAKLLPNNSEETAQVLCTSGSWIKLLDKERADLFYKSLVRRCRNTTIGREADRIRWFPLLNERGELLPKKEPPRAPANDE